MDYDGITDNVRQRVETSLRCSYELYQHFHKLEIFNHSDCATKLDAALADIRNSPLCLDSTAAQV